MSDKPMNKWGERPPAVTLDSVMAVYEAELAALRARLAASERRERALREALAPFARFVVPLDMKRKGYHGTVYATQQVPGEPATELTVDDFDRAARALADDGSTTPKGPG